MAHPLIANARYILDKRGMLPIYLIMGVTWRCNSKCLTCFNGRQLNDKALMAQELTLGEIEKIATTMGPLTWLLFTGGEPVMRPDLPEIAAIFRRHNRLFNLTIPSGGILTNRIVEVATTILESNPGLRLVFSFAVDGVGERHDEIRGFPGNFKKLGETLSAMRELASRHSNLSINLNTCVSDRNLDQVEPIMAHVRSTWPWVNFHGFELLRGTPFDDTLKTPAYEAYLPVFEKIKKYWSSFDFYNMPLRNALKAAKIHARQIELEVLRTGEMVFDCQAGHISAYMDPLGKVSLCELTHEVGNVRDHGLDFRSLWLSEKADIERGKIHRKECACTHSCFVSSSVMFNPKEYPRLAKTALAYR